MTRVVWSGVDTFEASFHAVIDPAFLERVKELKEQAKEANVPQPLYIEGMEFLVQPKGIEFYPYYLKHDDLHVRLSGRLSGACISVRGESAGLVTYGHENLYALADRVARSIGAVVSAGLSRLDVAVDFQGLVLSPDDHKRFVCPAVYRKLEMKGHEVGTFQFGKGAMVTRVYNKTDELPVSGKEWFQTVWASCADYHPQEPVWRFEVQMRREMLKEIGCEAVEEAFANLARILGTGLKWCSLRIPYGVTQTRWPVDPRWEELQKSEFAGEPLPRVREQAGLGKLEALLAMTKGCLLSMAARLGETEFEEAWSRVGGMMAARLEASGDSFGALVEARRRRLV